MIKKVLLSRLQKNEEYFFGLALAFLMISSFHTPSEGLYWMASAYSYTIAIVFFNLGMAFLLSEKKPNYFLAAFFGFIICGCNETSMVLWVYFLGVVSLMTWLNHKRLPLGLLITITVTVIGAGIMLLSPGNAIRAGYFPKSHNIVRTISNALLYSFIDPFKFLTLPIIAFAILNQDRLRTLLTFGTWKKHRKLWLLVMMGLFFISFAPSLWGMGRRPNTRTMNVIVHAYLVLLFPLAMVFWKNSFNKTWMKYFVVLFVVSIPVINLINDYTSGKIFRYKQQWVTNLTTHGEKSFEKADTPKTIHFNFLEAPAPHFDGYVRKKPDFFKSIGISF
jgi:hypothetical protein